MYVVVRIPGKHFNVGLLSVIEVREDASTCSRCATDTAENPDRCRGDVELCERDLAAFLGFIVDSSRAEGQVCGVVR